MKDSEFIVKYLEAPASVRADAVVMDQRLDKYYEFSGIVALDCRYYGNFEGMCLASVAAAKRKSYI